MELYSYSGSVASTMQVCKLRLETLRQAVHPWFMWPQVDVDVPFYAFASETRDSFATYMCHAVSQCWLLLPV